MRLRFLAVTSILALATVASAADPQLLKLVMPDAKVVSGIDIDKVMVTPFGQFFLNQLPAPDAGFQEFVTATGFDPRRDIHEILMASPGDPGKKSGLLLVRGDFDSARILSLFKAVGKTPENYHGVEILSVGEQKGHPVSEALAFLSNTMAVAGDVDSVRGAIDRRSSGSGAQDPGLSGKIGATSAAQDAWVVSIVPFSSFANVVPNKNVSGALQGDLIKGIQQSSGGVKFGSTIEISGELTARSDQDATSLADVLKFFMSMAEMNAPTGNAELSSLLHKLTVNTDANAVKVSVSIPENELEMLIKMGSHHAPRI